MLSIVSTVFHLRGHHYIDSADADTRRNDLKFYNDLMVTVFGQEISKMVIDMLTIKGIARYSCHAVPPHLLL